MSDETSQQLLPPGDSSLPGALETYAWWKDSRTFFRERYRQHGAVFKTRIIGKPTICFVGPSAVDFMMNPRYFKVAGASPWNFNALLSNGDALNLMDDPAHEERKQLVEPAFRPEVLARYLPVMQDIIETFALRWERLERFDFVTEIERLVASLEVRLILGQTEGNPLFREKLNELIAGIPSLLAWPRAMVARKWILDRIDEAVIEQRKKPRPCVLAELLAARDADGLGFTPENLRHEMLHLFIASYAPTRIGCIMQAFALGTHPDMMERARDEAKRVTPQGRLTLDLLKKLTFTRQFTYESRRKFPVFAHPGFRTVTQTCKYGGYTIPAGWQTLAAFEATMMNHQAFANPDNFDPERFSLDPNIPAGVVIKDPGGLVPNSYCPHGVGEHRCTGEPFVDVLLSALTALLLRSHAWYFPSSTFVYTSELFAIPKGGLRGRFHRVANFDKDIR